VRTLVWFRGKDLRVADHEALSSAASTGDVIPLFVLDPYVFAPERARETPHSSQFLLESLAALAQNIEHRGSRLLLVAGESTELVPRLAAEWRVERVVAQRWTWPVGRERDARVARALEVPLELHEGETLLAPGTLRTGAGQPYSVFTRFAATFRQKAKIARTRAAPRELPPLPRDVRAHTVEPPTLEALGIEQNPALLAGGERAARERLRRFLAGPGAAYASGRDRLDQDGTSRLSADLKFGTASVRHVWHAAAEALRGKARDAFLDELLWREFAYSTLWDRPALLEEPFRADFRGFPYEYDEARWQAWVAGKTGYPVVDAASRQLLGEGFVHNRARMISASFLTKHLLIDHRRGADHYMKYLTDGDFASNEMGWQWSAGSGVDAQPYFRVFNPITQGQKFDPDGAYVRRWVPELARMPASHIHRPWEAPEPMLREAGVRLDSDYPRPIVEHGAARERFLTLAKRHLAHAKLNG
jgi:deoxyribodipyrimidine photo-lyase